LGQPKPSAALYCRVSTADQSYARQKRDLTAFAARAGYEVVGVKETGSGAKFDRAERHKVMALAQARRIDVVLITELSRWGRSTLDLLHTQKALEAQRVSVIAMNGLAFDLATPHGRARTAPGAYPLRHRRRKGAWQAPRALSQDSGRNPTIATRRSGYQADSQSIRAPGGAEQPRADDSVLEPAGGEARGRSERIAAGGGAVFDGELGAADGRRLEPALHSCADRPYDSEARMKYGCARVGADGESQPESH
jgi:hypothetical protein